LFDLWDSAEAVRIDAERRGDAVTALRAGEQGVRVMGALSRQYGVTSKVVAENLEYAVQLHRTVGLVGEAHPAAVRAMAVTAHAEGFTQVGKDLTRFAEVVEARQKEKTA
jgi:hypothetical protein